MKLAEALIKRRDIDTAVANLNMSLQENVKVIEGTKPFEDHLSIADQMQELISEQAELIQKINKTNNRTVTEDGRTLDELITLREQLKRRHKLFDSAYKHAFSNSRSYNEVKYIIAVDMKMLKNKINAAAKEFRELDNKIQAINWITELL